MVRSGARARSGLAQFCVLAAAALALAGPTAAMAGEDKPDEPHLGAAAVDLSGRWEGASYFDSKASETCAGAGVPCVLKLDFVACGDGWCGIELGKEDRC